MTTDTATAPTTAAPDGVVVANLTTWFNFWGTRDYWRNLLTERTEAEFTEASEAEQSALIEHLRVFASRFVRGSGYLSRWNTEMVPGVQPPPMTPRLRGLIDALHQEKTVQYQNDYTQASDAVWRALVSYVQAADTIEPDIKQRYTRLGGGGVAAVIGNALLTRIMAGRTMETIQTGFRDQIRNYDWSLAQENSADRRVVNAFARQVAEDGFDTPPPEQRAILGDDLVQWQTTMQAMSHDALIANVVAVWREFAEQAQARGLCSEFDKIMRSQGWPRRGRDINVRVAAPVRTTISPATVASRLGLTSEGIEGLAPDGIKGSKEVNVTVSLRYVGDDYVDPALADALARNQGGWRRLIATALGEEVEITGPITVRT